MAARHPRQVLLVATSLLIVVASLATATPSRQPALEEAILPSLALSLAQPQLTLPGLDPERRGSAVTYLVVGSDRRAGLPSTLPALGRIEGEYADSILLWSVRPGAGMAILVLPRDLRVHVPQHGDRKLGSVLEYGPAELIRAVQSVTHVPIQHYLEVNFDGFDHVVNALGGVDVAIPRPIRDGKLDLNLPAGYVHLDGDTALRFVRARNVEELNSGRWVPQGSGDLGRIARQQAVVTQLVAELHSPHHPVAMLRLAASVRHGARVDSGLSGQDLRAAYRAVREAGDQRMPTCVLPTHRELPDEAALSPFPPQHDGSTVLRVVDPLPADQALRWFATTPHDSNANCVWGEAR